MSDGASDTAYGLVPYRNLAGEGAAASSAQLAFGNSGGDRSNIVVEHDFLLATPETVDIGDSFWIAFSLGTTAGANSVCYVTVDFG